MPTVQPPSAAATPSANAATATTATAAAAAATTPLNIPDVTDLSTTATAPAPSAISTAAAAPCFIVTVTLVQGRGLPKREWGGGSDPYAVVTVVDGADKQRRVGAIRWRTQCPVFNERFDFVCETPPREVIIQLVDKERFASDLPIGELRHPLGDASLTALAPQVAAFQWGALRSSAAAHASAAPPPECGELQYQITCEAQAPTVAQVSYVQTLGLTSIRLDQVSGLERGLAGTRAAKLLGPQLARGEYKLRLVLVHGLRAFHSRPVPGPALAAAVKPPPQQRKQPPASSPDVVHIGQDCRVWVKDGEADYVVGVTLYAERVKPRRRLPGMPSIPSALRGAVHHLPHIPGTGGKKSQQQQQQQLDSPARGAQPGAVGDATPPPPAPFSASASSLTAGGDSQSPRPDGGGAAASTASYIAAAEGADAAAAAAEASPPSASPSPSPAVELIPLGRGYFPSSVLTDGNIHEFRLALYEVAGARDGELTDKQQNVLLKQLAGAGRQTGGAAASAPQPGAVSGAPQAAPSASTGSPRGASISLGGLGGSAAAPAVSPSLLPVRAPGAEADGSGFMPSDDVVLSPTPSSPPSQAHTHFQPAGAHSHADADHHGHGGGVIRTHQSESPSTFVEFNAMGGVGSVRSASSEAVAGGEGTPTPSAVDEEGGAAGVSSTAPLGATAAAFAVSDEAGDSDGALGEEGEEAPAGDGAAVGGGEAAAAPPLLHPRPILAAALPPFTVLSSLEPSSSTSSSSLSRDVTSVGLDLSILDDEEAPLTGPPRPMVSSRGYVDTLVASPHSPAVAAAAAEAAATVGGGVDARTAGGGAPSVGTSAHSWHTAPDHSNGDGGSTRSEGIASVISSTSRGGGDHEGASRPHALPPRVISESGEWPPQALPQNPSSSRHASGGTAARPLHAIAEAPPAAAAHEPAALHSLLSSLAGAAGAGLAMLTGHVFSHKAAAGHSSEDAAAATGTAARAAHRHLSADGHTIVGGGGGEGGSGGGGGDAGAGGRPPRVVAELRLRAVFQPKDRVEAWFFRRLLQEFDSNADGSLDAAEIAAMLEALGQKLDGDQLDDLLRRYDSNGDGVLEYAELLAWLRSAEFHSLPMGASLLSFLGEARSDMITNNFTRSVINNNTACLPMLVLCLLYVAAAGPRGLDSIVNDVTEVARSGGGSTRTGAGVAVIVDADGKEHADVSGSCGGGGGVGGAVGWGGVG